MQTIRTAASQALGTPALLSTIFKHSFSDGPEEEVDRVNTRELKFNTDRQYLRPSEGETPLLVAHVCRSWRNVALDTPMLWAHLHLEFSRELCKDTQRLEGQKSALKFWLSHSRNIPVSVRLRISLLFGRSDWVLKEIPTESAVVLTDMVRMLFEYMHLWENIEILLPEYATAPFYEHLDHQYPHLISLRVRRFYSWHENPFEGRKLFLHSAPRIEELALPGRSIGRRGDIFAPNVFPESLHKLELSRLIMQITPSMHGSNLRKLALRDVRMSRGIYSAFPIAFPLLEELMILHEEDFISENREFADEDEAADVDTGYVVLDHLTSLTLRGSRSQFISPLRVITAPVTRHLVLSGSGTDNDIIQFLRRSQAPVESFSYEGSQIDIYNDWETYDSDNEEDYQPLDDTKLILMLREMQDLLDVHIFEPALTGVLHYLMNPAHLPRLRNLYNEGILKVACMSDGSPYPLPGPTVSEVLTVIRSWCREQNGPVIEGHQYLEKLSLPVHEEHERKIREHAIFRQVIVDFESTHKCDSESNGGEDYDMYIGGMYLSSSNSLH